MNWGHIMACSDAEVVGKLLSIYNENFAGKAEQRYLISTNEIRSLYGFGKLFETRIGKLTEAAFESGLYLFDLGEGERGRLIAVVKSRTVNRWRRVPKKIIAEYAEELSDSSNDEADEDE